jgi:hypothetical protein
MGTGLVPETLSSNELTRLCAREDYIESFYSCSRLNTVSIYMLLSVHFPFTIYTFCFSSSCTFTFPTYYEIYFPYFSILLWFSVRLFILLPPLLYVVLFSSRFLIFFYYCTYMWLLVSVARYCFSPLSCSSSLASCARIRCSGFDPRTVQLVASRYTDWAIPAHSTVIIEEEKCCKTGWIGAWMLC